MTRTIFAAVSGHCSSVRRYAGSYQDPRLRMNKLKQGFAFQRMGCG